MRETWDGKLQRTWEVSCGTGCRTVCHGSGPTTQAGRHLREVEGWGKRAGLWVCPDCNRAERELPFNRRWLRERRRALGLTIVKLAARIGCHEITIYRWLSGRSHPRPAMMRVLRMVLDAPTASTLPRPANEGEDDDA